jgi:hypothetical protein
MVVRIESRKTKLIALDENNFTAAGEDIDHRLAPNAS